MGTFFIFELGIGLGVARYKLSAAGWLNKRTGSHDVTCRRCWIRGLSNDGYNSCQNLIANVECMLLYS